jgi:crotonobetainyl-CoA:carnitine CoA-transferase CaiB-like acyl-CoA transferase
MPLTSLRVVEVGELPAGSYCARLLADFGAQVIRIEPPGGDPARGQPPLIGRGDGGADGAWFAYLNFGKSSLVLDPARAEDRARLAGLIAEADVCIDSAGAARGWGELLAEAEAAEGARVYAAVSWFGRSGPYRDFAGSDAVCRALAGMIKLVGPREGPPLNAPDYHAGIIGGLAGFSAVLAALHARGANGHGSVLDVSVQEACIALVDLPASESWARGAGYRREGINRFPPTFPVGIYPTADGWLGVTLVTPAQWRSFCRMLGLDDLADDPGLVTSIERLPRAEEIEGRITPRLLERPAREWFRLALELRLPLVEVPDLDAALHNEVFRDRAAIVPVRLGESVVEAPGPPMHLTASPPRRGGEVPVLGAGRAAFSGMRMPVPLPGAAPAELPLRGMRIVDLSMGWAGPLCTRHLADLGADVVKVEACRYPDWWRGTDTRPAALEQLVYEKTGRFNALNRNKRGISLDLTSADGVRILKTLVTKADAVVENYSTGVLPKLGLDYPRLRDVNPSLVMVSMSAFGATGAWKECRAYGSTLEQGSGLPLLVGRADDPPMMGNSAFGDAIGGYNALAAVLAALFHRQRTGQGQHIDLSQVECMLVMTAPWMMARSAGVVVPARDGNRHPHFVPQGAFRCAGEDEWVMLTVTDDAMWLRLCRRIGRPDLAENPELTQAAGRRERIGEIEAAIGEWTATLDPDTAMAELQTAGVAAGTVRGPFELLEDPHLAARGFYRMVARAYIGLHPQPSAGWRQGEAPYPVRWPSPTLGQFNAEVLGELAGMDAAELARLEAAGVIGTAMVAG